MKWIIFSKVDESYLLNIWDFSFVYGVLSGTRDCQQLYSFTPIEIPEVFPVSCYISSSRHQDQPAELNQINPQSTPSVYHQWDCDARNTVDQVFEVKCIEIKNNSYKDRQTYTKEEEEECYLRSLFLSKYCFTQTRTRSDSTDLSCTSSRMMTLYLSACKPFSSISSSRTPAVLNTIFELWRNVELIM